MAYIDWIIGLATFDLNGLPKEYYVSESTTDVYWVQAMFQTLGLRSLLATTLQLQDFRHLIIHANTYRIVLVHRQDEYLVILTPQVETPLPEDFLPWLHDLDLTRLQQDERFSLV